MNNVFSTNFNESGFFSPSFSHHYTTKESKNINPVLTESAVIRFILNDGRYFDLGSAEVINKSNDWLEWAYEESFFFVALDKEQFQICSKNTDSFLVKFLNTVGHIKEQIETSTRKKKNSLQLVYPFEGLEHKEILIPNLKHLINLEKEKFNGKPRNSQNHDKFYMEALLLLRRASNGEPNNDNYLSVRQKHDSLKK